MRTMLMAPVIARTWEGMCSCAKQPIVVFGVLGMAIVALMSMAVAKFCAQAEQTRDQLRHMARIASREFVRPNSRAAAEENGTDRQAPTTRSFRSSSSTATGPGGPVGPRLAHYNYGASRPARTGGRRRDPQRASRW